MAAKKMKNEIKRKDMESAPRFTGEQLASSRYFCERRDIVNAISSDGVTYTVKEMDSMVEQFLKGKVR